jgi:hypothetical protein
MLVVTIDLAVDHILAVLSCAAVVVLLAVDRFVEEAITQCV